jgi:hypothetical protein
VNQPGEVCANELLVDPDDPARSLLVTTLRLTAECGVAMPSAFLQLLEQDIACVEAWVNELATQYNAGIK